MRKQLPAYVLITSVIAFSAYLYGFRHGMNANQRVNDFTVRVSNCEQVMELARMARASDPARKLQLKEIDERRLQDSLRGILPFLQDPKYKEVAGDIALTVLDYFRKYEIHISKQLETELAAYPSLNIDKLSMPIK